MIKRISLFLALCAAFAASAADKREIVTLPLPHGATVADVICSEVNGHIGFNIPLAPQFTKRGLFRAFPKGMSEYPAYFNMLKGRIRTVAIIRFIKQSPELFADAKERASYTTLLKKAVDAHKAWYANQTQENLLDLHAAEDDVFEYLKRLSLENPSVREKLEKILSTPVHNIFSRALRVLILPQRTYLAQNKCEETVIKLAGFTNSSITALQAFAALPALHYAVWGKVFIVFVIEKHAKAMASKKLKNEGDFELYARLNPKKVRAAKFFIYDLPHCYSILISCINIIASFTDFKLTPEPGNGINVKIQVAE